MSFSVNRRIILSVWELFVFSLIAKFFHHALYVFRGWSSFQDWDFSHKFVCSHTHTHSLYYTLHTHTHSVEVRSLSRSVFCTCFSQTVLWILINFNVSFFWAKLCPSHFYTSDDVTWFRHIEMSQCFLSVKLNIPKRLMNILSFILNSKTVETWSLDL